MSNDRLHVIRCHSFIYILLALLLLCTSCSSMPFASKENSEDQRPIISIMAPLHFPHPPSDEMIKQIENLTHTKLDINWVPDGIYTDKMNTALSTNSLKKATFVKHTDYIFVKNAIRSGSFWEIGPYLEQFPNLHHLNADILGQAAVDGRIYGLYTERPSSRQGIILREDWLDNLGLDKPGTIEELYEVIRMFTLNDPDRNGQKDTVGLADRNDLVFGAFKTISSYFGTPNNWGIVNNKVVPEFETQPYVDTMNFMKRLYDEQLMNNDFAVTSKEMQRDKVIRGTAGVYIGSMTDIQRLSGEAKQINPEARFTLVNRILGPDGYHVWSIPNYNGLYLFSKKAIRTEKELLEQLAFFDRTMDKDVANLMRYGVEGKHYKLVDQKVQLPEETSQMRVNEVNALYTLMIADLSNPNLYKVAEQETMWELAERLSADNDKFIMKDPTIGLESKTYDEKSMELYKIISDATYKYILGQINLDGFYQEVDRWKRSGGNSMISEYTDAYFLK
ncbi:putative aldouronate transport system substrate-binding protein [Paenibacillus castaneae]|uniref:extracellular solute-binding protein n=1 Tax=Paenibacillus castaneae TaxID=474957 RepID=UPI001FBA4AD0|nr:extracellular solute-binding protein [Paenibacillus castaneae]NIK79089.1 putative aldouronate transport system substrate-binding protein [Paenibacillus castaneae]